MALGVAATSLLGWFRRRCFFSSSCAIERRSLPSERRTSCLLMPTSAVFSIPLRPVEQMTSSPTAARLLAAYQYTQHGMVSFFRLHHSSLQAFFPGLNERSRYNRRKRDLWSVILAVRVSL